jgi:hypothetical protein
MRSFDEAEELVKMIPKARVVDRLEKVSDEQYQAAFGPNK